MTLVWASPILLVAGLLTIGYLNGHFMLDFKGAGWVAGHHILDGRDPYQDGYRYIEHQAAIKDAGGTPQTIWLSMPVTMWPFVSIYRHAARPSAMKTPTAASSA